MISDQDTDFLFLADSLAKKHPLFATELEGVLLDCNIPYAYLPNTKDIWAVDYMPVQIEKNKFVQFTYAPDYLNHDGWRETISDVDSICGALNLSTLKTSIVLDGGNVVKGKDRVILCEKVFQENPNYTKSGLISALEDLFETDRIIFIPRQPYDSIGHADGMIRFMNNDTVWVNHYAKESQRFRDSFFAPLKRAGLTWVELPYEPYGNKTLLDATGTYINYLHMHDLILVPTFDMQEDEVALTLLETYFPNQTVRSLKSTVIARKGGVLNCISWNILRPNPIS